jgi:Bacterial Ig-like domain (group 3)/FG-GAP-like repeat
MCSRRLTFLGGFLITSLVASAAFASDPIRFAPPARYAAGTQPKRLAVADLNGDGKLDVVATSELDQKVYVLLSNGDGTFQPAVGYATANASPMGIVLADFTSDGKIDIALVTANYGGSYPAYIVFPGNGDGTFGTPIVTKNAPYSPIGVRGFDFDKDGRTDLLVQGNGGVSIGYSNGDGTFRTVSLPGGGAPGGDTQWSSTAADLTNSGRFDVIVGTYAGYVVIYRANADGTFQAPSSFRLFDSSYGGVTGVSAADLNEDGYPDLVVMCSNSNVVEVLINNGDGTFHAPIDVWGGSAPVDVLFADFNGDGKADGAFADWNNSQFGGPYDNMGVTVVTGLPGGTLDNQNIQEFDVGNHAGMIAAGDFNGDGRLDIVTVDAQDNAISVLLNGGTTAVSITTSTKSALPGATVTITVTVHPSDSGPAPTGSGVVLISDSSGTTSSFATAPLDATGTATTTTTFPGIVAGSYVYLTALYSGDANRIGSSSDAWAAPVAIGYPVHVNVSVLPSGVIPVGTPPTVAATVTSDYGSPTGTVYFYEDNVRLGKATLNGGSASITAPAATLGTHTFKVLYVRDKAAVSAGFVGASDEVTLSVGPPSPVPNIASPDVNVRVAAGTTTLVSAPAVAMSGSAVTLQVGVSSSYGTPTGSVTFSEDGTPLGTVTLANGATSYIVQNITAGLHNFTVTYGGDNTYLGSQSGSATTWGDFVLSVLRPVRPARDTSAQAASASEQPIPARVFEIHPMKQSPLTWEVLPTITNGGCPPRAEQNETAQQPENKHLHLGCTYVRKNDE